MAQLCVTVDLDEVYCYSAIHGVEAPDETAHAVYTRALPRIAEFLKDLEVKGTLFAVGGDLEAGGEASALLKSLGDLGHEIGNHTMSHRYDFAYLTVEEQAAEIDKATEAIERHTGRRPVGFRAPGYNMSLEVINLLAKREYAYDSSVFPCPLYFTAKAAVIGAKALMGQASASKVGDPRILSAPTGPYRIGSEGIWARGDGFIELPITVVTPARLPFIGTSLALMGSLPASALARVAASLQFVNLELHGIDFLDADGDGLGFLKQYQPDLRIPLLQRRRTLEQVVGILKRAGLNPSTLSEAAGRVFV